jgi:predicted phosphodiesterase
MPIRFLHLSDIHFKCFKDHKVFDLDEDVRTALETDLQHLVDRDGAINSILIGGDIAFSGDNVEYATADEWIAKICKISCCSTEVVLPIPGNHDVYRSNIIPIINEIHQEVKSLTTRNKIDKKLQELLGETLTQKVIMSPLYNYENFAQKYGAVLSDNDYLYWEKKISAGGLVLKVRGINSAIFSDKSDDDSTNRLVIGTAQATMSLETGVVNIILCHHPPSWLVDGDQIENDMCQRANLLLFGHIHALGMEQKEETIILSAGAVRWLELHGHEILFG